VRHRVPLSWRTRAGRNAAEEARAKLKKREQVRGGAAHGQLTRPLRVFSLSLSLSFLPASVRWRHRDPPLCEKSLGIFRHEIKFREARLGTTLRARAFSLSLSPSRGAAGIVLTCLSQILTQVGLARRPGTKRSRNKMRRNDPHSRVHVLGEPRAERRARHRAAAASFCRGNEGEAET